ncbi:MAG: disulfide bond formation protein B [Pseudomonadota bacterium]|nr:disulfide bond formation protein B [Pseudomonadota bacterium]
MGLVAWLRSRRVAVNLAGAVVCFALYGYALYTQYFLGFQPCPLCMFQRFGIIALGVAFVASALLALPRGRWAGFTAVALVLLATAIAAGVAGRHVYVQAQPPGTYASCGASLEWMLEINPVFEVIRKVLSAPGDCANVDWSFLGLAMPAWVLAWALALGALGVLVNWPRRAAA